MSKVKIQVITVTNGKTYASIDDLIQWLFFSCDQGKTFTPREVAESLRSLLEEE